jgi:pantoate--beta-alanine ligase
MKHAIDSAYRNADEIGSPRRSSKGWPIATAVAQGRKEIEPGSFVLDHLEARHAETLKPMRRAQEGPVRLLVAARIGKTRLIDNIGA